MNNEISAPAKLILFGEHAVVHGQPAIAVPVSSLRATATIHLEKPGTGLHVDALDMNECLPVTLQPAVLENTLTLTARLVLEYLNQPPPNATIRIASTIPMAGGLGSGAAVSACVARAVVTAVKGRIDTAALNEIVYEVEKLHHGTPSGIDNTVVVYEQPVFFQREHPIEILPIKQPFTLVVADTGVSVPTHVPVGDVRCLYEVEPENVQPVFQTIGQIAREARTAIVGEDTAALGPLMTRNHDLLRQLTVSSNQLDHFVDVALNAGALGAKLSGAGRGGNMIALVTPDSIQPVKKALTVAGAKRVFHTIVSGLQ